MGPSKTLSVVIPTHGRVDLFGETLASVEAQTFDDFELVITDDSALSTDQQAIAEAVHQYAERTNRAAKYVFSSPRIGQAANTNQGLQAATGQVLRILHSDDLVRPGCFDWELGQWRRFPEIDLFFQDCVPFHDVTEITWRQPSTIRLVDPATYFRRFLSTCTALPSGLLFARESFDRIDGMREDLEFLCDWEFFSRLLLQSARSGSLAAYAAAGNVGWRLHEESTTSTKWRQHYTEHAGLMEQWRTSLQKRTLEARFSSPAERESFLAHGDAYRNERLIQDVSNLSPADFRSSLPWFREHLSLSMQHRALRKAGGRILRRAVRTAISRYRQPQSRSPVHTEAAEEPPQDDSRPPEIVITTLHGDPDAEGGSTQVIVPYDNSINLWNLRHRLASARRIRITNPNWNRFFSLVIHECLKYVRPDSEVEFIFHDNTQMTWFGLKAIINQVAAGRFELLGQNRSPREGTQQGFSKWQLRYRCTSESQAWHREPINGLTIGILTLGDRAEDLDRLINSARQFSTLPIEIVIVAPESIQAYEDQDDIRQIRFSERDELGWITRKKNLICEAANYTDVVVCHDRFEFTPQFFEAFESWGWSYGIAAVRLELPGGKRALDWAVVRGENHTWCEGGLLSYRDYSRFSYVPGGVTLIRKCFWRNFKWSEDLYWNEHEDVELCRRIQRSGERISFFPGLMIATRDRWIDENPLIEFSDEHDLSARPDR